MLREILARTGAQNGDLIFFGADKEKVVNDALGALRAKVGHDRGFAQAGMEAAVGRRLPDVRVRRRDARRWAARHHPFTAPKDGHEDLFATDPGARDRQGLRRRAERLGDRRRLGAHPPARRAGRRCSRRSASRRRTSSSKFGFLLDALQYGAPPHGGIAFGLDRIVDDDVRASSRSATSSRSRRRSAARTCSIDTPTPVTEQQLRDLHIRVRPSRRGRRRLSRRPGAVAATLRAMSPRASHHPALRRSALVLRGGAARALRRPRARARRRPTIAVADAADRRRATCWCASRPAARSATSATASCSATASIAARAQARAIITSTRCPRPARATAARGASSAAAPRRRPTRATTPATTTRSFARIRE